MEINGFEIEQFNIYGFPSKAKNSTCPLCSEHRKKKTDKCLSIFWDTGLGRCNHCGESVQLHTYKKKQEVKRYVKPNINIVKSDLSDGVLSYMCDTRKISLSALNTLKIRNQKEWMPQTKKEENVICFDYYLENELINVKYRDGAKNFKLFKGAEKIFYNIDNIATHRECIIVEGECFTGDTEVLTRNGWVSFKNYKGQDVMQRNGKIGEFIKPNAIIKKEYNGDLIKLTNQQKYYSLTTPKHNIIVESNKGVKKVTAEHLYNKSINLNLPRVLNGVSNKEIEISDDEIRFNIAISADFSIRKGGDIYGSFKKERKVERIKKLLVNLGIRHSINKVKNDYFSVFIHRNQNLNCFKLFPNDWLNMSTRQLNIIIDEILYWDGNRVPNRNQIEYSSKEIHNAKFIQTVAHLTGRTSTIIRRSNEFGKWFKVSILFNKTHSNTQALLKEKIKHNGLVYCVSVDSGELFIRQNECISITGNCDVLSYVTAGYVNCVSVPNGFNLKGDTVNLDYLDNYYNYFENKEVIYLAVDNDAAGIKGQKELIRRLGAEKCKIVDFEDCKDANDYLIKYGKEKLSKTILKAKDVKIEGVFELSDVRKSMLYSYRNGQNRGTTTYVPEIDKCWTWRDGETTIWTGYQNEGKSLLLNQLCLIRAYWEGAKVAIFSPENMPLDDFYNDIIEMYIGKSCDPYYSNNYMSEDEFKEGMDFVNDNFFLIHPEGDFKLESIFERVKYLVRKRGIRTLIIDPYNTIEHKMNPGEREDLYISRFMAILKRFEIEQGISIQLVAHQLTARKNEQDEGRYHKPMLNNVKGGGTFADKADNVNFVWRPNRALDFRDPEVIFGSQKIKKQKLVGYPQDIDNITFDVRMNRYLFNGVSPFTKIDIDRKGGDAKEITEPTKEVRLPYVDPEDAFGTNNIESDDNPF